MYLSREINVERVFKCAPMFSNIWRYSSLKYGNRYLGIWQGTMNDSQWHLSGDTFYQFSIRYF